MRSQIPKQALSSPAPPEFQISNFKFQINPEGALPKLHTADIERLEAQLLDRPQVEMPLTHRFAPGVYLREIFMPKGTLAIGHEHKTEHFNIVLSGKAAVLLDGVFQLVEAPCTIKSPPGVRKILFILEDMRWQTVHVTNETDIPTLEEDLVIKSKSYRDYHDGQKLLALARQENLKFEI